MRFIHFSDLHLGIYKYGKFNYNTGLNTRLEEDLSQLDYVIDFAIKNKVDFVFIAGDIFDKKKPDAIVRREFIKRMKRLQDAKIYAIVLMGNHDNVKAFDNEHCLAGEKLLTNKYLYIVDKTIDLDFPEHNLTVVCMPSDQVKIDLDEYPKNCKNVIVLGHYTIRGAKKDNHTFASGEYISYNYFNNNFIKYVAMGHIHQMQIIAEKIVYSGSLNRINFNDENVFKGFIIGKLENDKISFKHKQIKAREFLTIQNKWHKSLKKELSNIEVKNKIVKVILKAGYTQYIPINKIKKYLLQRGAIVDSVKIERQIDKAVRNKDYKQNKSIGELLKLYLKDDKKTIDVGIKILQEVE